MSNIPGMDVLDIHHALPYILRFGMRMIDARAFVCPVNGRIFLHRIKQFLPLCIQIQFFPADKSIAFPKRLAHSRHGIPQSGNSFCFAVIRGNHHRFSETHKALFLLPAVLQNGGNDLPPRSLGNINNTPFNARSFCKTDCMIFCFQRNPGNICDSHSW